MQKAKNYARALVLFFGSLVWSAPALAQWVPDRYSASGLPSNSITNIIQTLMYWILGIFGFIAVIGFVISGIMYLTAVGDETQKEKAKKALYYSIIGVIVGLLGLIILIAVTRLLGGGSAQF